VKTNRRLAFAFGVFALAPPAFAADPATSADQGFVTQAVSANQAEIALGKMAQGRSGNVNIKEYGAMMVRDHSEANTELVAIATSKDLSVPDSVSSEQDQRENTFESMLPAEFDRKYLEAMVTDHAQAIALFQQEADSGADKQLRDFAARTLPAIKKHFETAKSLQSTLLPPAG
jgi:putative membrane protein